MADIILKDKNDNTTEYPGVTQIEVPAYDIDGNLTNTKFTQLSALYAYSVTQQSDGKYLVNKKLDYIPYRDFFYFSITETEFDNFSKFVVDENVAVFFLTTKVLTVGSTYDFSEMY